MSIVEKNHFLYKINVGKLGTGLVSKFQSNRLILY